MEFDTKCRLHVSVGCVRGGMGRRRRRPGEDEPGEALAGDGQREDEKADDGDRVACEQLAEGEHVHSSVAPVARRVQRKLETYLQNKKTRRQNMTQIPLSLRSLYPLNVSPVGFGILFLV